MVPETTKNQSCNKCSYGIKYVIKTLEFGFSFSTKLV